MQAGFLGVLTRTFEEKGYTLRVHPGAIAQWEETPPNDGLVKTLWEGYDTLRSSPSPCKETLRTPPPDTKTVMDSNAVEVIVLASVNADVLARIGAAKRAAADIIIGIGGTSLPDKRLYFSVSIVDGNTGRLLYSCQSDATGNYLEAPDSRLSGPVHDCLRPFFGGRPEQR
jgi:hypothetical protein